MMLKIALINCRMSWSSVVPTGLLSIGTVLHNSGFSVRVFDAWYSNKILINKLIDFEPDIIGFSFMTTEYPRAKELIVNVKKIMPNVMLVAGGYHVSALPERSLRNFPLDVIVISEGEITFQKLCNKIKNRENWKNTKGIAFLEEDKFICNEGRKFIENLDNLPMINRELLEGGMSWYLTMPGNIRGQVIKRCTTIITARGCPGNCSFCSSRAMWSNRVRQRSVNNVVEEIEYLIEKYGVSGLFFLDDTFTARKQWVLGFCETILQKGIKLIWGCSARVNTIDDEMLKHMADAGCVQLDFGVESGSDKVLRVLKKGQNNKMIKNAFALVKKNNLKSLACFIIGSPGETVTDMNDTLRLAKEIKPNFAIFSILTPLPGSPLYNMAIEKGWIKEDDDFNINWSIRHSSRPVMGIEYGVDELLLIRKKMEDAFFWRNYLGYFLPLTMNPNFVLLLIRQLCRKPKKYIRLLLGKETRRFSGVVENVYYDYKEYVAEKASL